MKITVGEIANLINGNVEGDSNIEIVAPAVIEEAVKGTITFLSNARYENHLYTTQASAIIINEDFVPLTSLNTTYLKVQNVNLAMSIVLDYFNNIDKISPRIEKSAVICESVTLGTENYIGHYVTLAKDVKVGNNTAIHNHVVVGANVRIGNNCIIYPGAVIYANSIIGNSCIIHANSVIGSDGFGFIPQPDGTFKKIPHVGNVIIEDDVEIGANSVIDRASIGSTIIRQGVKMDNLIQIAHNVQVGAHTAIAAQTGIAGSTKVGKNCLIGGQVGIAGHISIADKTLIQAKSGVSSSITEKGKKLYGYPAIDYQKYLKSYAYFKNLDQMVEKLRNLEKEIDLLKQVLK